MIANYVQGQLVRFSCEFRDATGALVDPDSVTFKTRAVLVTPADVFEATYPPEGVPGGIVRDAAGQYHIDRQMTESGPQWWRWESTGDAPAPAQGYFTVDPALL